MSLVELPREMDAYVSSVSRIKYKKKREKGLNTISLFFISFIQNFILIFFIKIKTKYKQKKFYELKMK